MVNNSELSPPQYQTTHQKNIEIPMRDGTTLQVNITRSNADGQFPVLPERTPYDNEAGSENIVGSPEYYASRGYVVVIQDMRGWFASEGDF